MNETDTNINTLMCLIIMVECSSGGNPSLCQQQPLTAVCPSWQRQKVRDKVLLEGASLHLGTPVSFVQIV